MLHDRHLITSIPASCGITLLDPEVESHVSGRVALPHTKVNESLDFLTYIPRMSRK